MNHENDKRGSADFEDITKLLREMKNNPEVITAERDAMDVLIGKIISIEKKHLYQVESTSTRKRLEEIRKLLDDELLKAMEK